MNRNRKMYVWLLLVATLTLAAAPAHSATLDPAKFTADLNALVAQGNDLVTTMSKISLSAGNMSTQLAVLETAVVAYLGNVGAVFKSVSAAVGTTTFSITTDMLTALETLSSIQASLASGLQSLSTTIVNLAPSTGLSTLQLSLAAMLRLSDDIGVMADRILEMADKILIMADNIGIMADRIISTQVIQSSNLKVVVDAVLQTQQNTITLISIFLA